MAMFDRLHPKMRRIGEVELVQPSIELYMQVALVSGKNVVFFLKKNHFHFRQEVVNYFLHQMLRMPEAKMSNEEHAEIGQEKV